MNLLEWMLPREEVGVVYLMLSLVSLDLIYTQELVFCLKLVELKRCSYTLYRSTLSYNDWEGDVRKYSAGG